MALGDTRRPLVGRLTGWVTQLHQRDYVVQMLLAGAVGAVLGVYTIFTLTMEGSLAPVFLLVAAVPFVAVVVGGVRRLFLVFIILDISFPVDIHFGYQEQVGVSQGHAGGGVAISVTTISLLVLYMVWFARLLARQDTVERPLFRLSLPLILYVAVATLSTINADSLQLSIAELTILFQTLLLYIYIIGTVKTEEEVTFIAVLLVVGLLLESVLLLAAHLVIKSNIFIGGLVKVWANEDGRAGGAFSPNIAGAYFSFMLPLAMAVLVARLKTAYRWLAVAAFGLGGISLILTQSRGGWMAFGISIMLFCWITWRRGWLSTSTVVVMIIIASVLFALSYNVVIERLTADYSQDAAESRLPLITLALRAIADKPGLGVGANNLALALEDYVTAELSGVWLAPVHNQFLRIWSETGLVGLMAFVLFLLRALWHGWRVWRRAYSRLMALLALAFSGAILGHMAHMQVDSFLSRTPVQSLWLIAGLLAVMHCLLVQETPEPEPEEIDESVPRLVSLVGGEFR
jgi:O-antigen ligase